MLIESGSGFSELCCREDLIRAHWTAARRRCRRTVPAPISVPLQVRQYWHPNFFGAPLKIAPPAAPGYDLRGKPAAGE